MAPAHLPVSKRTGNVTPATVTLLTYCALPILRIGDISRRVIEGAGSAKRTSKGKERALTLESKIVRTRESDIKERIQAGRLATGGESQGLGRKERNCKRRRLEERRWTGSQIRCAGLLTAVSTMSHASG